VKRERLDFLADNPLYTKRFAHYVGQRCRQATIKDIAEELKLDWDTVKTLEKQYMQAQLARAGRPGPKAAPGGEQAAEHGLRLEGIFRPALGLRARGLGAAFLRELARELEVAAARTV